MVVALKSPSSVPTESDLNGTYFFAGMGMEPAWKWRSEIGTLTFDGLGGIGGTWNSVQSGTGGEIVSNATLTGNYSIDAGGLLTLVLNANGSPLVTYLASCGSGIDAIVYSLPDNQIGEHPRFGMLVRKPRAATNNATILGNYHLVDFGRDHEGSTQELESRTGVMSFDGEGTYTWRSVGSSSLSSLVENDVEIGTYSVMADGSFTLTEMESLDPDVRGRIQEGSGTLLLSAIEASSPEEHVLGVAVRK